MWNGLHHWAKWWIQQFCRHWIWDAYTWEKCFLFFFAGLKDTLWENSPTLPNPPQKTPWLQKTWNVFLFPRGKKETAAHWITAFNCARRSELTLEDILAFWTLMRLTLLALLKAVNQPPPHLVVSCWRFAVLEVSIELRSSWYSCIFFEHNHIYLESLCGPPLHLYIYHSCDVSLDICFSFWSSQFTKFGSQWLVYVLWCLIGLFQSLKSFSISLV